MPGDIGVDIQAGAGEPDQRAGVLQLFVLHQGNGPGQAGLQLRVQLLPTGLDVEDLGQLGDAFVDAFNPKRLQASAVGPDQVVLGLAVRGHQVGGNLQLVKLLASTDCALRANHPLKLHGDQPRALADHRFETRLVIGQAFDPVVLRLVLSQHIIEPQRSTDQFVAQSQGEEHLGAGLADGHRPGRGVGEGQRAAAVLDCKRVMSRGGTGEGS
ncbi:hypothetical protein D3C76_1229950 [compost metagenome]